MDEIVNRVANSKLMTIDLEEYYPSELRTRIDISKWLFEGFVLKEKDFRASIASHDWAQYKNQYIALFCSTEAIIPSWAYLLLTTSLSPFAIKIVVGNLDLLETTIYQEIIQDLPIEKYIDKRVIIKGCAHKPIPISASVMLVTKLQPIVKSLMFGEACSTVPLFKK